MYADAETLAATDLVLQCYTQGVATEDQVGSAGPDIDDGFALALAVAEPGLGLELVTTVDGNTDVVTATRLSTELLATLGRSDVPVAQGAAGALSPAHRRPVPEELGWTYRLLCGLGSHDLSAMRELLGRPERVLVARQWRNGGFIVALRDYGDYVVTYETGGRRPGSVRRPHRGRRRERLAQSAVRHAVPAALPDDAGHRGPVHPRARVLPQGRHRRRNGEDHTPLFAPEKPGRLEEIFDEHLADKGDKLSDELDTPHFRDPRVLEFLLSEEVLDTIEPLVGPDIALWSGHFISKEPFTGRATPWHEDSSCWKGRFSSYDRIVTIWLALENPSTRGNGCMRVIPGSHLAGRFSDNYVPTDMTVHTFHAEIADVDESKAVDFELRRGEFSLHAGRIVHGAKPNTSSVRRTEYTMRYFPSSVTVQPIEANRGWRIWLARGRDLAGNSYENVPAGA